MSLKTAIGLMSGTSMDGIDVALLRTDGDQVVEFGPNLAIDYPVTMRKRLEQGLECARKIVHREQRPGDLADLEGVLTEAHVQAVKTFLASNRIEPGSIDVVGFHGQTVLHRPNHALTVQLGDGPRLARETGIDVVYDMRAADMNAGGQGAPLVPVFHQAIAAKLNLDLPLAFVNIGGISNITYLGAGNQVIAFDTGPGNALIDQWVQAEGGIPFDQGGSISSEGVVVSSIVERYMTAEFFKMSAPKSLDRNDFEPLAAGSAELSDGARTLAHVSAAAILRSVEHLPESPGRWIICGGGRLNDTLMREMSLLAEASKSQVMACEEIGLQGDMLEAQAFAYLAVRSLSGLPLTLPTTTGCLEPTAGGVLVQAKTP